jgi:hypothetical protein
MAGAHRVGVLTFHRCINYGSYWQSRALVEGLRGRGLDAVVLDHRSKRIDRFEWRNAFQPTRPYRAPLSDYRFYRAKTRRFMAAFERLPLSPPFSLDDPAQMERCGTVVVGSDEVWNFRHPWYAACPIFFGDGLKADRLVAYAASFGSYDAASPLEEPWRTRLNRFSALAVRDENSRRLVRDGLGADPPVVLDPCLQFADLCRRAEDKSNEAVIYGHSFPSAMVRAVRAWAKHRGVRLVSVGYRNDWADEQNLSAGPETFARLMSRARAVITNYFHGCVFALLNARPFICSHTEYRQRKIAGLLFAVDAENHLIGDMTDRTTINALLDAPPAEHVGARISALRARSAAYLDHALA